MELQKMFVTLALKADEFKSGLEQAGRQAEGLRSRIGGAMGAAGRVATGALLGIGAAAVGGFGLAIKSSIDMNASLEQSTMQFTTLMGDADMAAEHVGMLFELGAKTPFETGPIIAASKHLQVFGGAALNTKENLILIGDSAAAVGQPFDEVAFWVGRAYSAIQGGQPFGEAAMRLQEMGLMTPEVRQQMEGLQQSGADAGEVWGVLEGQLGNFTGAMELQAGSWAGITSTLSDTLQMMAANALAPFFELAKQAVQGLSDLFNSPAIQAGIAALAEKLTIIIQAIADFVTGLTSGRDTATVFGELAFKLAEAFGATRQEAVQVYMAVKEFIAGLMEIITPITTAVAQFVSWKDVLIAIGILVASVVIPAIVSIVTAMAPILLTIAAVIAVVALLRNAWENNWGGIRDKVAEAWAVLGPIFQEIVAFLQEKIGKAITLLREWWEGAWPKIHSTLSAAWEKIWPVLLALGEFLLRLQQEYLRVLHDFWVNVAWPAIQRAIEIVWPIIQRIFTAIKDFIVETLIPTIRTLYEKWTQEWWPTIQTVLENVWTIIKGIFEEIGRWVNENIVPWIEFLHDKWVEEVWPAIQTKIEEVWAIIEPIWEAIRKWAAETIPPILESLKGVFEGVMSGISAAIQPVKDLWDRFVDAVSGFWDWISNKVFNFNIHIPDLPSWAVPGSPLPIHTAWLNFADDMPGIGERVSGGFEDMADALRDMLDPVQDMYEGINGMLGFGDKVGGLARGFAGHFERLVTDPLKAQMDELSGTVSAAGTIFENVFRDSKLKFADDSTLKTLNQLFQVRGRLNERITNYRARGVSESGFLYELQSLETVNQAIDAFRLRNDINAEYIRQQEKLLALEKARADMDFLKTQMDLLNLMREHKIPLSLLNGVTMGLTADPGQLMGIMVDVMERIVRNTQYELNKFNQTPAVNSTTPGTDRSTMNIQNQNINGGQHIYLASVEESELERLLLLSR